jgi:hypothetical protein
MEAKHFASCCPLSVWKREVSLLLLTQRILYIYMCCGNGSETFRFLLPIGCIEARSFSSFTNTTIVHIYMCCGKEAPETFRFLLPIGCMEARSFALLLTQRILYIYMCCGNGSETFRFLLPIVCMEARSFASFTNTTYIVHIYVLCGGSETFRFLLPIVCIYGSENGFVSCCPLVTSLQAKCFAFSDTI